MAKPELGLKRVCVSCGTKFYDLTKQPAVCPRCQAEQPAEQPRLRRAAAGAAGLADDKLKKRAAAAEGDTEEVELEEVEGEAVEDAEELEDEDEAIDADIEVEGERDEEA